ncbi:response regulator receiver sensor signal transduction histidine kinase [Gloeothece citriformis PCC 7424]|uniref:histidine kinase n=1 Tax=Gloeothece citriformis (strain PCC 7424) TaxID=65393 RepID=B7KAF3_GLOC7|nr:ATP-binding protein [Gloeothece citriformis]ACK72927.1 response regulator receiver sensor signal transduction histidine kinase [Gloeothece citriformis PCC 7424]
MSNEKILIVEDEAIVAEDIASRLERMGYIVTDIVASGEDAIISAITTPPDLVLMDIMLQGKIDGITAAEQIYTTVKRPVVYLTAYGDEDTLQRAKLSGSFGYLLKPFHERELRVTIEIALSRHQAETEIQQALELAQMLRKEAEIQSQLKSQYISLASHEFRNPLTNIKAWAQLLQLYGHTWSEEKQQKSLERIQIAAEQMNQLLEDISTLGRTDIDKNFFHPVQINLSQFCENLLKIHQIMIGDKYSLTLICEGNCEEIYLDEHLLAHLLNNLISNGVKYSPHGGKIILKLSCQETEIILQVQDQGIGIPQGDLHHLFEPFQRATNVGSIPGTGLGLVIVKRVVELHGGTINIQSKEGKGTTFIIRLPRRSTIDN